MLLAERLRGLRAGQRRGPGRAARGPGPARGRAPGRGQAADRGRAPPRHAGPLDVSLLRRLARAELAEREGRPGAALAELRAGLAMVQARRGRLGSVDLQTGTAALGAELAAAGLRLALDRGSAPLVFAWLERSRAQAFRVRPVRPPADPQAAALAGRAASAQLPDPRGRTERQPRPGRDRPARRAAARDQGARLAGQRPGRGHRRRPALGEVSAALEESGQSLVGILAPARPDARGGGAARIGAPDRARRLRHSRRGGQATERRPRHAGRTAAAGPARGCDQGVDPASDGHAHGRDRRAAARLAR